MRYHDGNVADEPHRKIGIFRNIQLLKEVRFIECGLIVLRVEQTVESEHAEARTFALDHDLLLLHILKIKLDLELGLIEITVEYREDKVLFSGGV